MLQVTGTTGYSIFSQACFNPQSGNTAFLIYFKEKPFHVFTTMVVYHLGSNFVGQSPQLLYTSKFSCLSNKHTQFLSPKYPFLFFLLQSLDFSSLFHCLSPLLSLSLFLSFHFCFFLRLCLFFASFLITSSGLVRGTTLSSIL